MENKKPVDDLYGWRSGGRMIELGDENDGGVVAMMTIGDSLICVTRKAIYSIKLADVIDPNRVNPAIPDSKQKLLDYGSDTHFVARTLLQAKALFEEHCLPKTVDCKRAMNISFDLLKEICAIYEQEKKYNEDELARRNNFTGKMSSDRTIELPIMTNLENRTKAFIISTDHAVWHFREIARLFYPSIASEKWPLKLVENLRPIGKKGDDAVNFLTSTNTWIWTTRNLRNAIEHPAQDNQIEISNYTCGANGHVSLPSLSLKNKETPLPKISVSLFMKDTIESLLLYFEIFVAHLCNAHSMPFAGDLRYVIEIPEEKRRGTEKHIRFGYEILWTK